MSTPETSRREFLIRSVSGLGAAWVAANYVGIVEASAYAQQAAGGVRASFVFFTPLQAMDVDAMAAQIIPSDATPGAREARVTHFIDRALTTFERDRQADYTRGLGELTAQARQVAPDAPAFAALTAEQQIKVLTAIERTPFFNLVRTHTITGFLANPIHGGNADKIGWKLVGYDDSLRHSPPFGYYDALPETRR
jgi:gluconate 2-dehydrogenase gamma chain